MNDDYIIDRKSKRKNRRNNQQKYKAHLKKLNDIKAGWYLSPVYYYRGSYKNPREDRHCYYKRIYKSQYSKYLKKCSNKAVRRCSFEHISSGNNYRRLFDYNWELY